MWISLRDITLFSRCPSYFKFFSSIQTPKDSKYLAIIKRVIKKAYIRRTEYLKKAEWRVITSWIDKEVFKDIDVTDKKAFQSARKLAELIFVFIDKWYTQDYLRGVSESFVDIPFRYEYGSNLIYSVASVLQLDKTPVITYIDEKKTDDAKMYNDLEIRGLAWLALEELKLSRIKMRHIFVGPASGIEFNTITVHRYQNENVKKIVKQVATLISKGYDYPSFTAMCGMCQFKKRCFL